MLHTALFILVSGLILSPLALAFVDSAQPAATESFFFARQEASLLALGLTAFLGWNRRKRLASLPSSPRSWLDRVLLAVFGAIGAGLCIWSRLVDAQDLYAFSLVVLALAFCVLWKGAPSLGILRMPIFAAFLILPVPSPLYNELVWFAQRLATDGAAWTLAAIGKDVYSASMLIRLEQYDFWVIETCSGLRATELLTQISILILELSASRTRADRLLIAIAIPLALFLNILRIVAVALFATSTANELDHATQGLVAVFVGTLILVGLDRTGFPWINTVVQTNKASETITSESNASAKPTPIPIKLWLPLATFVLLVLAFVPSWPKDERVGAPMSALPTTHRGWVGEDLDSRRLFFNSLPITQSRYRRFERERKDGRRPERVDVYVAEKSVSNVRASLSSSKFGWLGPDWEASPHSRGPLWQISQEGTWHQLYRGNERSLTVVWRTGARPLWTESFATLFALDRTPFRRTTSAPPRVIRLSTPVRGARDEAHALENAQRTLHAFLSDFADPLEAVGTGAWTPNETTNTNSSEVQPESRR